MSRVRTLSLSPSPTSSTTLPKGVLAPHAAAISTPRGGPGVVAVTRRPCCVVGLVSKRQRATGGGADAGLAGLLSLTLRPRDWMLEA